MKQTTIGFALTGSFCTFEKALEQMGELEVAIPIMEVADRNVMNLRKVLEIDNIRECIQWMDQEKPIQEWVEMVFQKVMQQ